MKILRCFSCSGYIRLKRSNQQLFEHCLRDALSFGQEIETGLKKNCKWTVQNLTERNWSKVKYTYFAKDFSIDWWLTKLKGYEYTFTISCSMGFDQRMRYPPKFGSLYPHSDIEVVIHALLLAHKVHKS